MACTARSDRYDDCAMPKRESEGGMTRQDAAVLEMAFNKLVENMVERFRSLEARVSELESDAARIPHKPLAQKLREKARGQ